MNASTREPAGSEAATREPVVLDVTITKDGFDIPGPRPAPAGPVTFRVRTPDPEGHKFAAVAIRDGVAPEEFLSALARSFSWDPETKSDAAAIVGRDGRFLGGVYCTADGPAELTLNLEPGTYHFLDYDRAFDPDFPQSARTFEVAGNGRSRVGTRPVDSVITLVADEDHLVRFEVEEPLPATGTFLVRNATDHLQEAVVGGITPETTEDDITNAIHAYRGGPPLDKEVFVGAGGGMLPLSAGEEAVIALSVPPGRYGLCSYTTNPHTGTCNALQTARRCVTFA